MTSSLFYDASSANCLSEYIFQLFFPVLLSSPLAAHFPLLGSVGSSICCQRALGEVWDLSGFCAVLQGRSYEAKPAVKKSKLKDFGSTPVPWKVKCVIPHSVSTSGPMLPLLTDTSMQTEVCLGLSISVSSRQKQQEFRVWRFTTSDSELKTYFLNSKPKECIQLDEFVNNLRHCCHSI